MTKFLALLIALSISTQLCLAQTPPAPRAPAKYGSLTQAELDPIVLKSSKFQQAIAQLPDVVPTDIKADVEVYAKAVEYAILYKQYPAKSPAAVLEFLLKQGNDRLLAAREHRAPWREVRAKPIVRGYYSRVDGSLQPYSVVVPESFWTKDTLSRLDLVLHGRDGTISEAKFINAVETSKAKSSLDAVIIEPYGRGNNAYRWAGETDVFEALDSFTQTTGTVNRQSLLDPNKLVLRGFSMGGAGTWHLGLHHGSRFAVIGPGAGFSRTHGYIKNLPAKLPKYQEDCLRIYDAIEYAENVFEVPVVAYAGEKDPQKSAADGIIAQVKDTPKLAGRIVQLVGPGLEHQMPAKWMQAAETEYQKHLMQPKPATRPIRFVTFTTRYNRAEWVQVAGLDRHYSKATLEGTWEADQIQLKTDKVRAFTVFSQATLLPSKIMIDDQSFAIAKSTPAAFFAKENTTWKLTTATEWNKTPQKTHARQGPIDDAFMSQFLVLQPKATLGASAVNQALAASLTSFQTEWQKNLRGKLPIRAGATWKDLSIEQGNLVFFGTPTTQPLLADLLTHLPIKWDATTLSINGTNYDPATHYPVLIYPRPDSPTGYVVLNSGHTFHEADFQGTNALLYPRLGDWAIMKVGSDTKPPTVAAAGVFDEHWQFRKSE